VKVRGAKLFLPHLRSYAITRPYERDRTVGLKSLQVPQQKPKASSNFFKETGLAPPVAVMQAMPDSRQQSFEEIYGPPENFLEIEVSVIFLSLSFLLYFHIAFPPASHQQL
jgi:hypothetical protein